MRRFIYGTLILLVLGCSPEQEADKQQVPPTGESLAKKLLIVDTHIDVPHRLFRSGEDISVRTEQGQFDYPRAVEGGLNAPFMSIYVPASVDEAGGAKERADALIDIVEGIVKAHPDKFALAYSARQVEENFRDGKISLPMGMENGGPIEGDLENLEHFYARGIRYITLAHSKSNHLSDSSYDEHRQWHGLSDFGKEVVKAMNRLGIMVDVSHISDEAFYDVIETTEVPVIASHSAARYFTPGFERNMDDDMLRALAANGGVMQLNIGSSFISEVSRESSDERNAILREYLEAHELEADSDEARQAREQIFAEHPFKYASLDDVLDQVEHVVKLIGVDHVGVGTDFDGVGDTLPVGFKDVSEYPNFIDGLLERGYSEADIEKILGGNLIRVWREVEEYAKARNPKNTVR